MRKVKFFYRMALQFSQPIWQHSFSLRAFPLPLPEQQIYGLSWSLEPDVPMTFQRDCFGNVVGSGRFEDQHNHFQYEMSGVAWLEPARKKRETCPAPLSVSVGSLPNDRAFAAFLAAVPFFGRCRRIRAGGAVDELSASAISV